MIPDREAGLGQRNKNKAVWMREQAVRPEARTDEEGFAGHTKDVDCILKEKAQKGLGHIA